MSTLADPLLRRLTNLRWTTVVPGPLSFKRGGGGIIGNPKPRALLASTVVGRFWPDGENMTTWGGERLGLLVSTPIGVVQMNSSNYTPPGV